MPDTSADRDATPPSVNQKERVTKEKRLRFTVAELAGGLGDLGTFLPLSLALAVGCGLDLAVVFVWAGLMNVATGVLFGQPVPVQPMKAIAAIAVAASFGADAVMAAGIAMGVLLVGVSLLPRLEKTVSKIPRSWVAAIQLGVGLKLALLGVSWVVGLDAQTWSWHADSALPCLGWDSVALAVAVMTALLFARRGLPYVLLAVVALGMLIAATTAHGSAEAHAAPAWITPWSLSADDLATGALGLALPQLPLTLLNSVVAVCALSAAYYPGHGIGARRMSLSVGAMNLAAVPLGGMPMCHGAGGLAAQHRFGARTGGAVVMLGGLKIATAVALWPWLPELVAAFPRSVLAVLIVLGGLRLAAAARPAWRDLDRVTVLLGGVAIVLLGTLAGMTLAIAVWSGMRLFATWNSINRGDRI